MLVQSRRTRVAAAFAAVPLALAAGLGALVGPDARPAAAEPVPSGAPATPQERAAAIVTPAVVRVEVRWEGWVRSRGTGIRWDERPLSITTSCSGVTISNDGYVITTGECVDAGPDGVGPVFIERIVQRQVDEGRLAAAGAAAAVQDLTVNGTLEGPREGDPLGRRVTLQRGTATAGAAGGEVTEARVVTLHPPGMGNMALLKMDRSNQPMVELAEADALPEDGAALVLGYPPAAGPGAAVDVAVRPASIAPGPTPSPVADQEETPRPVYLRDVPGAGPGVQDLAGGPVTNLDGQVVGLVTTRVPVTPPGAVVLANPAVLAEDLEANKVNNDLGKIDKDFRAGVDAYTEGRYDDCIRSLDDVLAALPTHQHAQQLRQQAVALRELERGATGEPDKPRGPQVDPWMIAVLATVGLLVGGAVWRRWRPAPPPPAGPDQRGTPDQAS